MLKKFSWNGFIKGRLLRYWFDAIEPNSKLGFDIDDEFYQAHQQITKNRITVTRLKNRIIIHTCFLMVKIPKTMFFR